MLSTKTRTTIIALVASASFVTASAAPAVSSARPVKKGVTVTCPDTTGQGAGQPGEIRTTEWNVILPDGTWGVERETKICGSDGKWHKVVARVLGGTSALSLSESATTFAGS
jgi:hypothetical protein